MTQEQAQQVLDELDGVRPEMLTGEGKRLFEAIMTIADNRDELKKKVKIANKGMNSLMQSRQKWKSRYYKTRKLLKDKDRVIDLMSEQLTTPIHNKEWIKMFYENKVKERDTNENTKSNK